MQTQDAERNFSADMGIAIGPIVFVIAILGILAAAIAAGSGSFTSGSAMEGNRIKAGALIEAGDNLKIGFERVTLSASVPFNDVTINTNNTSTEADLFSPTGGGIMPPSIALAEVPGTDVWYYPLGNFNGLGQSTDPDQLAVIKVSSGVCDAINSKIISADTPAGSNLGNFHAATLPNANFRDLWPAALIGRPAGCVRNTGTDTPGYYFYQVIGIR